MPQPLEYDREATEAGQQSIWKILVNAPIWLVVAAGVYLFMLAWSGRDFSFGSPAMDVAARVALVVLPLMAGPLMFVKSPHYKVGPGEVVLNRYDYLHSLPRAWWYMGALWPTLIFGLCVLLWQIVAFASSSTLAPLSARSALLTFMLVLALAVFYGAMFLTQYELRCSEEGLRLGLNHFVEWKNIHHITDNGSEFEIFHRANPNLPITRLPQNDPAVTAFFREQVTRHHGRLESGPPADMRPIQMLVGLLFAAILMAGFAVWIGTGWDARWIVIGTFAAGVAASLQVEKVRGLPQLTKISPAVNRESLRPQPQGQPQETASPIPDPWVYRNEQDRRNH